MAKKATGKVSAELEKAINELLKEAKSGQDKNGNPLSLLDRLRIIDRQLKLESIKLHQSDSEWGSAFNKDEEGE